MDSFGKKGFVVFCMYVVVLVLQIITLCLCLSNKTYGEEVVEQATDVVESVFVEEVGKVDSWEVNREEAIKLVKEEDVISLAKLTYGEARGIPSTMEKAAVMWCACNRADVSGCSIAKIASNRSVFYGYHSNNPVTDELRNLAEDVLIRYHMEKMGLENVGRVLPKTYLFFSGDGKHNYFREEYRSSTRYSWYLDNPYDS